MPLDKEYLKRREHECLTAALLATSQETAMIHTRFARLYHAELEKLRSAPATSGGDHSESEEMILVEPVRQPAE